MHTTFARIVLGLLLGFSCYLSWLGIFGLYPAVFCGVIVALLVILFDRQGV